MAQFHCSNPGCCCSNHFVITQCINEVSLNFRKSCYSCPQKLVKVTSCTGLILCIKLNNWPIWHIFILFHILVPCSAIPFSFLQNFWMYKDSSIQDIWINISLFCVTTRCKVKLLKQAWYLLLVTKMNLISLVFSS